MPTPRLPSGIHVFERGWLSANNILFTGGDETLLVDSGYCTHTQQTLSLVEKVLGNRSLDLLANTHLHSDHCGGNAGLQARYPSLQTLIPPGHARQVEQWDTTTLTYEPTGQLCPKFTFDQLLCPGEEIWFGNTLWEIHAATGHDPHSVIFFEPVEKILISADALWENGFGVVFPELEGDSAFSDVAATLSLIGQLNPATIIPGHGRVFSYTPEILTIANRRLESFVASPVRHGRHAVKVLIKFKLLEVQQQPKSAFIEWAARTSYFEQIRMRFFEDVPFAVWIEKMFDELVAAGVAKQEGENLVNL
ncbi:MAG: beta-lactamase domain protein [Polaromonas sp.]|jgi:glyoxylase-like metal-dependent hydrolase (beta-lactamase superfamily II)|nr:beta-lactamase domain protein [Polaromonas sp.]